MKTYILILCSFLFSIFSYTQKGVITGTVLDKATQQPIPYANVVLKSNNAIATGGITNEQGTFLVKEIPYDAYAFEIQFIGYKTVTKTIEVTKSNKKVNLGNLYIEEDAVALASVEIVAERSTIEQKIDRKVINVGKDLTTVGASASDIMGNIPSVSVNQDGDISFRGNENVRILIDGKPTNLSSRELLQQIPSTSIKTIELITNPSAKYNPEGMSGIINISLKKNTNLGFNTTINSGFTYGERARYNNSIGINYRKGKANLYGNYNNRFGKSITEGTVTRVVENNNQLTDNLNEDKSHLFKLGVDYFINDKNTLSVYTNQNLFTTLIDGNRIVSFFDNPSADFRQRDITDRDNINSTYNADFKHVFAKDGHTIELEVDYNTLDSDKKYNFSFTGNNPVDDYNEHIDDQRTNTTINLDYINPLSENTILELGIETRLRRTDNSYITENPNFNSATFFYDRDIYSFYTTFSQKFDKWQYNIGVRLEDYSVDSQFDEVGESAFIFTDKLFNIYPSGFLKYTPNEDQKNTYQLSFSRRIDRPSLNQINPIRQLNTPQIILTGNPSLVPQFTNSIEVNYNRKLKSGTITLGAFYRRINDEINRRGFFDENNPNLLILDYANFDSNVAISSLFKKQVNFL